MIRHLITFYLFFIGFGCCITSAQSNPSLSRWLQNTTVTARHYVSGNSTPINDASLVNVQSVKYSATSVYATTTGLPAYITGPFLDGNPNVAGNQNAIFKFPLNPVQNTGTATATTGGNIGVFINGVALFDYRDGASWQSSTNTLKGGPYGGTGDGVWNRDAVVGERIGFDCAKGHPAGTNYHHHQNPSAFNLDLNVISTVCNLYTADGLYAIDSTQHSPLLGFAYDGFPIYGAYAYKNVDGTGGIVRMKSSYNLRSITVRNTYANGTSVTAGPAVSTTYPLGYFKEDYQYVPTSAATPDYLDDHNGRFCVTPEYPNGTYCYFATVGANWNSAYPYVVGPTFYGVYANRKVTSITETVSTFAPSTTPSIYIAAYTKTLCSGTSVTFTSSIYNGGINPSFQWKKNGVNVGSNSNTYTSSSLANNDVITCVLTTASSTTATSNAITMTVNTSVTPTISINASSTSICSGTNINFTASTTNGGNSPSYQWQINGVNTGSNSPNFSSASLTNGQIVTCVLNSNAACASVSSVTSNSQTITVNPYPVVSASNVTGCSGIPITLNGSPAGGSFSLSNPYTGPSATYTYSYTDVNGCSATSSAASITIHNADVHPLQTTSHCNSYLWVVNGVTYTNSGLKTASYTNIYGCDSSYTLNLNLLQSTTSYSTITATNSYTWSANGNTYTTSGLYTHTLTNANGCDSLLSLQLTIVYPVAGVNISVKAFLAGPYNSATGLMQDSLRINHIIPLTEPYSSPPYSMPQISNAGGETTTQSILNTSGSDAIVDWVFLELRSSSNPSSIVATKRALIQRDGDVVSASDGISPVLFPNQLPGDYYVSIKHRNHLGVMSANAISLSNTTSTIDFTNSDPVWTNPLISNAPRKEDGAVRLLICGDANTNKNVKYNGNSNDKDKVLMAVGSNTPNNILPGYRAEDINLDAKVKYNNTDNDRAFILNSVGSNTPNVILFQHTPN